MTTAIVTRDDWRRQAQRRAPVASRAERGEPADREHEDAGERLVEVDVLRVRHRAGRQDDAAQDHRVLEAGHGVSGEEPGHHGDPDEGEHPLPPRVGAPEAPDRHGQTQDPDARRPGQDAGHEARDLRHQQRGEQHPPRPDPQRQDRREQPGDRDQGRGGEGLDRTASRILDRRGHGNSRRLAVFCWRCVPQLASLSARRRHRARRGGHPGRRRADAAEAVHRRSRHARRSGQLLHRRRDQDQRARVDPRRAARTSRRRRRRRSRSRSARCTCSSRSPGRSRDRAGR